jgi:hypothetical protein
MATILIYTVGTRDILLDQAVLESQATLEALPQLNAAKPQDGTILMPARLLGSAIKDKFAVFKPFIKITMLNQVLDYVQSRSGVIDKVYFVVTDQQKADGLDNRFMRQDTLFVPDVIGKTLGADSRFKSIANITVKDSLTNIDENYKFFSDKIKTVVRPQPLDTVYLSCQGGIDAINTGLLFATLDLVPKHINIHLSESTNIVSRNSFPVTYQHNQAKARIKTLLGYYNFEGALLEDVFENKRITTLLKFAIARQNFDFDKAKDILIMLSDDLDTAYGNEYNAMLQSMNDPFLNLERETWTLAKIDWQVGRVNVFLMKIFSLTETLYKAVLEKDTGLTFAYDEGSNHQSWSKFVNDLNERHKSEKVGLWQHLKEQGTFNDRPNIGAYIKILKYIKSPLFKELGLAFIYERALVLRRLRNDGAHGHANATKDLIFEKLGGEGNFKTLSNTLDKTLCIQGLGGYDVIRVRIIQLMDRL